MYKNPIIYCKTRTSAAKDSDLVEIAQAIPPQSSSFSLEVLTFRDDRGFSDML